ncbi:MAG: hypothetical protein AB1349_12775 [Elusimicrobiota bacterium]
MNKNIDPSWENVIRAAMKYQFCEFCDIFLDKGVIIFPGEPREPRKTIKIIKRFKSSSTDTKSIVNLDKIDRWKKFITWCCEMDVHRLIELKIQDGIPQSANTDKEDVNI